MNEKKVISIIVPTYNEQANIEAFISRLQASLVKKDISYEIIFIDDHSTDGTYKTLQKKESKHIKVFQKEGKKGKAYSLVEGFAKAKGDVFVMIDADLQYPPEAIPEMLFKLSPSDIVIAERKTYKGAFSRRFTSRSFRFLFGYLLFGLNTDIQSGLKVFTKQVWDTVAFIPSSGWTFDLEFLHRAKEAGYQTSEYPISFVDRENGFSKVNGIKTSIELGRHAIAMRLKKITPFFIASKDNKTMHGAGIRFKKQKYITHTTIAHHESALDTFTETQKVVIAILLLGIIDGFLLQPLFTLQVLIAVLSFIYFIDVLFNLYLVLKSLHDPQEVQVDEESLKQFSNADAPIYSILCPLYKEAHIIPQFLEAIAKLDYPKNKLDVMLLLEEDDTHSIEAVKDMKLPSYVRSIVVPHSVPKTKPKACNYGLAFAKGKYLVIYDAEDVPDPLQLKKAYLAFQQVPQNIICLQAKLNYYNPHQNWLTRFFTAEYSLWFDITLTGLQSLGTNIPLGGTSNHFRTADLQKLQGWDPFNVTEDADLGIRLFKKGYKTAIIDSVTLEEANSDFKNWLRQRSRWIKGYMQTYLVHTRQLFKATQNKKRHSLFFHLTIGGKIAFILINPILWVATIAYFALYAYVGPQIEALYPPTVFYMAGISLVFGNFLFIYYYMLGCMKKQQWSLIKYVYLIPIYWLMISIAGAMALYQLIFRPHYWEKTIHGLHMNKNLKKAIPEIVVKLEEEPGGITFPKRREGNIIEAIQRKGAYISGGLLILANMTANVLNFAFNAYLGRVLDLDDFGTISLVASFLYLASIISNGFNATVTYRSGYFIGKYGEHAASSFWGYIRKYAFVFSVIITIFWLIFSSGLNHYFKSDDIFIYILFGIVFLVGFAQAVDQGYLSAKLLFATLAGILTFEPLVKLLLAILFVQTGYGHFAYAAVPLSIIMSFLLGWFIILFIQHKEHEQSSTSEIKHFPKKFFIASMLTGLSSIAFLSFDVILAKHFLSAQDAGRYALISLVGKMIFFLGNLSSPFIFPLVSRNEGARKDSQKILHFTLAATAMMAFAGFLGFGVFGYISLPILYGQKAYSILPYLPLFGFAMFCFAVSRVYVSYYLAKKVYSFPVLAFLFVLLQILLISKYHDNIQIFVLVMGTIGFLNLFFFLILDHVSSNIAIFERNVKDFLGLFSHEILDEKKSQGLSILFFNWRDTRHRFAGGAEVYIQELAKRWVKEGNKVTIFCGNDGKNARYELIDGVEIIRRGGFHFVYVWAFLYYAIRLRNKFDIIIDSENGIPFFTPLYARQKVYLLIHHVHQEVFRKSLVPPFSWIASFLELRLMPFVYRDTEVITVSPSSKAEILRHGLTKTDPIIIYNGVDLNVYRPGVKHKTPLVVYLGRLQEYKSLHIFLHAAKQVLEKVPQAQFVIAGDGEEKKNLQNLAKKLGIAEQILFVGKISEKDKVALYQRAWIFVNPSFMEGWGITTIEANACGTPAIASDVPGLRDSVKDNYNGFLIPYGKSDLFANAIMSLLSNTELRKSFNANALVWARNFDWETSAGKLMGLIKTQLFEQKLSQKAKIQALTTK